MALLPILDYLNELDIVFASSSPSRREVLEKNVGLKFGVEPSLYDESQLKPSDFESFEEFVLETAYRKVEEVRTRLEKSDRIPDLIFGADTMVALGTELLGKPIDDNDAFKILSRLSGQINTVYTGVVIITKKGQVVRFTEASKVTFGDMTADQIRAYIATRQPMNKAGAYGIQDYASSFIRGIEGNYFNILGLPVYKFCEEIQKLVHDGQV